MVVNIQQIQNGIIGYVENEIASKAVGVKKFGIYFMLPIIKKTVYNYIAKAYDIMPDLFDENKNIKIDDVYNYAKSAIQKSGQFEFAGIIFNETDVDKLYSYIKGTASE
jgi:hypothetical protein